jgi:hypothetical protein
LGLAQLLLSRPQPVQLHIALQVTNNLNSDSNI